MKVSGKFFQPHLLNGNQGYPSYLGLAKVSGSFNSYVNDLSAQLSVCNTGCMISESLFIERFKNKVNKQS